MVWVSPTHRIQYLMGITHVHVQYGGENMEEEVNFIINYVIESQKNKSKVEEGRLYDGVLNMGAVFSR